MVPAVTAVAGESFEVVLVDDGSRDRTWPIIAALARKDCRIKGVRLSRNFGHQYALSAGLAMCQGEAILAIDADLQDPPELLNDMYEMLEEGADVVYGQRIAREGETAFKKVSAALFYRALRRLTAVDIPSDAGDFRLMRRPVVQALLEMPESHRFIRGMVAWLGFRQVPIPYERQARAAGVTKYPVTKMMRLALDAVTSFSTVPLRLITWLGLTFSVFAIGVVGYTLFSWLALHTVPGWTSAVAVSSLLEGLQLFCIGILGEYVGRTYLETKRRPLFVIAEVMGKDAWRQSGVRASDSATKDVPRVRRAARAGRDSFE
jgi:dolichol-phosphate mannosyltransferase